MMLRHDSHGRAGLGGDRAAGFRAGRLCHRRHRRAHRAVGGTNAPPIEGAAPLCRPAQRGRRRQRQEDPAGPAGRPGRAVEGGRQRQEAVDPGQRGAADPVEPVVDLRAGHRGDQARRTCRCCSWARSARRRSIRRPIRCSSAPPPMPAATTAAPRSPSSRRPPRSRCGSALPPWRSRCRAARSTMPRSTPRPSA